MSRRLEIERRSRRLSEVGEIMVSMKNLAVMETLKLSRVYGNQRSVMATIGAATSDFATFFPDTEDRPRTLTHATLILGSERGFCGDFNEEMLTAIPDEVGETSLLIAVGDKVCTRLRPRNKLKTLNGPVVAEEVPEVLDVVLDTLEGLDGYPMSLSLSVVHRMPDSAVAILSELLPPFRDLAPVDFEQPPLLNLDPDSLRVELVAHYVTANLSSFLYASLLAENNARVTHLEGAIKRLEEKLERFGQQSRALRQEEITEEIEVILLGAESLDRGQ